MFPGAPSDGAGTVESDGTFVATQNIGQEVDWTGTIAGDTVEGRFDFLSIESRPCHNNFSGSKIG